MEIQHDYSTWEKQILHDDKSFDKLICETPSDSKNTHGDSKLWNLSDCLGYPMEKACEFHIGGIVRYARFFVFSPCANNLAMFLMMHKSWINKRLYITLWYEVLPSIEEESKFSRSLIFFL